VADAATSSGAPIRVKICGLVRREDARAADEAGADYLGVIASPGFRRSVAPASAREVLAGARARKVAVVVDMEAAEAAEVARAVGADVIQLHGSEEPSVLAALREAGSWTLWKAVRAASLADVEAAAARYGNVADALLVEGWKEGVIGGGGARLGLDPGRVRALIPSGVEFVLAGGLDADTVAAAVSGFRPDVVDVSSGVERAVGAKDPTKVAAFIREARVAAAAAEAQTARAALAAEGTS